MFSASKLNPYFKELYVDFDKEYTEEDPVKYLTQSRIDVIAKIIYCEYYLNITPTCFNRVFYYLHLKRWKGFKAKDTFKKNFLDYENEYQKIIDSINKIGFDMQESIIPVDIENKIIDGSHRLGATIVLRKRINVFYIIYRHCI